MSNDALDELYRRCEKHMLGNRHAAMLAKEAEVLAADTTRSYTKSPAGRRALRGFPCVGTGGIGMRQDPLHYLLDVERDPRNAE